MSLHRHHPSCVGVCPCRAHQVIIGHAISISAICFLSISLSDYWRVSNTAAVLPGSAHSFSHRCPSTMPSCLSREKKILHTHSHTHTHIYYLHWPALYVACQWHSHTEFKSANMRQRRMNIMQRLLHVEHKCKPASLGRRCKIHACVCMCVCKW